MISITAPRRAAECIKDNLIPGERIACRNATVFEDKDGNYSGYIDNDSLIVSTVVIEDE